MGRFKQDLRLIAGLLGHGLEGEQGLSMYTQALGDKRFRQDQREEQRQRLYQDLIPTLQQGADFGQSRATLDALADAYGLGDNARSKVLGRVEESFFPYGTEAPNVFAAVWDESDEGIIEQEVTQGAAAGLSRGEIRERLSNKYRSQLGPAYDLIRENMHSAINRYYSPPETVEEGQTRNWMERFNDERAAAPRPTTAVAAPPAAPAPMSTVTGQPSLPPSNPAVASFDDPSQGMYDPSVGALDQLRQNPPVPSDDKDIGDFLRALLVPSVMPVGPMGTFKNLVSQAF